MKFLVVNIIWFPYFILENVYESDDFNFGTVYKGGFFLPGDKWTNEFLKSLLEKQIKSAQEKKGGGEPEPVLQIVLSIKNTGILII